MPPDSPPSEPSKAPELRPILLGGPTAVGKSAVALLLAERLNGEIISADSMQVYRGLDIGTAKPTVAERRRIPHHLLDVVGLDEAFDAAQFLHRAQRAVEEIQGRGRVPIFCGGTGLYLQAWRQGLGTAPPADAEVRAELEAMPAEERLRELAARDPVAFAAIDQQNPRRVIRALEVIRLTNRPFSEQRSVWEPDRAAPDGEFFFGLVRAAEMHERIATRVDAMFRAGLVAETEQLLTHGLAENRTAMQAIGYRQVVDHLRGSANLAETIEAVKIRTRQFAKRQLTWFRRQAPVDWVEVKAGDSAEVTVVEIMRRIKAKARQTNPK